MSLQMFCNERKKYITAIFSNCNSQFGIVYKNDNFDNFKNVTKS